MNQSVTLPPAPLSANLGPETLVDAPVRAYLMDGRIIPGRLKRLDATGVLGLQAEAGEKLDIPFNQLRLVKFSPLPVSKPQASQALAERGGEVLAPPAVQNFQIIFKDGRTLAGQMRGLVVDELGLHLFEREKDGRFARLFVPHAVLRDYHVGDRIGEALIQQHRIRQDQLEAALNKQQELRKKKIGEYIRRHAVVSAAQLKEALDYQQHHPPERLGEVLLEEGIISPKQLRDALEAQRRDRTKKLGDILVEMGALSPEELHIAMAHNLGIPFVRLRTFDLDPQALKLVTVEIARKHELFPLMVLDDRLVVAMADPFDMEAIHLLRFTTGYVIEVAVATRDDIQWAIDRYYSEIDSTAAIEELEEIRPSAEQERVRANVEDIERMAKERPIIRLVNGIILDAINMRASDIHIRAGEKEIELFYRINGVLKKIRSIDKRLLPAIVTRIKILGRLNIAERRLPQDGRTRVSHRGSVIDLRISVIPTVEGESVVIRILDTRYGLKSLDEIGFSAADRRRITDLLNRTYGLFLVTGPTGSGKTTTLYAALNEVKQRNVNIVTVEDPVEYHIEGIEQIQAYTAPGYTFAVALKHILRHDPDVIMIGEMRDEETAEIAVKSALTGHLVLSTLHTNNAAASVTRLMDMGIQAYLIASTLIGVLAQRLVRRNCPHCLEPEEVDPAVQEVLGVEKDEIFYRGRGCDLCNNTGFSDRIAVYELLVVTQGIRDMITPGVSAEAIEKEAVKEGMVPLTQEALQLARQRAIPLAEVYRIRLE